MMSSGGKKERASSSRSPPRRRRQRQRQSARGCAPITPRSSPWGAFARLRYGIVTKYHMFSVFGNINFFQLRSVTCEQFRDDEPRAHFENCRRASSIECTAPRAAPR